MLRKHAERRFKPPTYAPSDLKAPYASFIQHLNIPRRDGKPDMLLHQLGMNAAMQAKAKEVVGTSEPVTWFINTSGSGKTRISLEALCLLPGFYFVAEKDGNALGSSDFSRITRRCLSGVVQHVPDTFTSAAERDKAFDKNTAIVNHAMCGLLLARASIFSRFIDLARKSSPDGKLLPEHRRAWLLLQLMPTISSSEDYDKDAPKVQHCPTLCSDIFAELTTLILNHAANISSDDFEQIVEDALRPCVAHIGEDYDSLQPDNPECNAARALIVLDEAQTLLEKCPSAFKATSNAKDARPLLRQVVESLLRVGDSWPQFFKVLGLGTGITAQRVTEALHTRSGKSASSFVYKVTGAFDEIPALKEYVHRYVPRDLLGTADGKRLLQRLWACLRGHHRFLSNFIGELIRNNYQSPHRLLTSYVLVLTDCHLEDARKYEGAESPLAEGAISQMGHVLPVAQMSVPLQETFGRMVASYLIRGKVKVVAGEDEHDMISYGVARYSLKSDKTLAPQVDEPLVFLAGARYFDPSVTRDQRTNLLGFFGARMNDHSAITQRDGFEENLIYAKLRYILNEPQPADKIFTFVDTPKWAQGANVVLVGVCTDTNGSTEVHSMENMLNGEDFHALAASLGIDSDSLLAIFDDGNKDDNLTNFVKHLTTAICCLPGRSIGPDIVYIMKLVDGPLKDKLFWVLLQLKNHAKKLANDAARHAIRTITPAYLGAAKVDQYEDADKKQEEQQKMDDLRELLKTGFDQIPGARPATEFGEYNVLRVMACTSDMDWYRINEKARRLPKKRGGRKPYMFEEELINDKHPFATLNIEFIDDLLRQKKASPLFRMSRNKPKANKANATTEADDVPVEVAGSRKRKAPSPKDSASKKPRVVEGSGTGTRRSARLAKKRKNH
ncbi:hypothetical protein GGF50DRAFT_127495 [Schizophyllum commune]